jgi:hypothetical protein
MWLQTQNGRGGRVGRWSASYCSYNNMTQILLWRLCSAGCQQACLVVPLGIAAAAGVQLLSELNLVQTF